MPILVGRSVIRERRKNSCQNMEKCLFSQPLNKAALMHIYPNNWLLFKEENKIFFLKKNLKLNHNESIFALYSLNDKKNIFIFLIVSISSSPF